MWTSHAGGPASPMRLLEMLPDHLGVFEALAHSAIKLNGCTSPDELNMLSTQCLVAGGESRESQVQANPRLLFCTIIFRCKIRETRSLRRII
jgi:hypothetical protein